MRSRTSLVALAAVVAILLVPGSASAKGVQRATITGPNLDAPITFRMNDSLDGVEALVNATGIYPSLFETQPNPVVQSQPTKELGPRYDVAYVMKVPGRKASVVHQDLYPYAQPDPVAYTAPGQPVFDGGRSVGGWYVAGPSLLPMLVSKGLPEPATDPGASQDSEDAADDAAAVVPPAQLPPDDPSSSAPWLVLGVAGVAVAALAVRKIASGGLRRPVRAER